MAARDLEQDAARDRLLDAALPHVAFDGWGEAAFLAAATKVGMPADLARVICPRGAVDLAVAYHRRGDQAMLERLAASDLGALRFREKITAAVRFRLEGAEREVVRRGAALFALPQHTATGVALIWAPRSTPIPATIRAAPRAFGSNAARSPTRSTNAPSPETCATC